MCWLTYINRRVIEMFKFLAFDASDLSPLSSGYKWSFARMAGFANSYDGAISLDFFLGNKYDDHICSRILNQSLTANELPSLPFNILVSSPATFRITSRWFLTCVIVGCLDTPIFAVYVPSHRIEFFLRKTCPGKSRHEIEKALLGIKSGWV